MQSALELKDRLPAAAARGLADAAADHALNQLYRAVKNHRAGAARAAGLDLVEMLAPWLTPVFALQGRHRPYNRFLAWELERQPLTLLPMTAPELLATGDWPYHQEC